MPDDPEFPEDIGRAFMTIERLRDEALSMFDRYIEHQSAALNPDISRSPAEEKQQFLTLEETENIVREYAVAGPGVYAIGGDTSEEAFKQIRVVMAALLQRIMSNVLRVGAGFGLLDVMFDGEANDFRFDVSSKGHKLYERLKAQIENGEEVELDLRADEED